MYGKSMMGRTQHKLTEVSRTHVGEIITKMEKCALVPGGTEVILYSTIMGGLGCMIPLTSREDVEFFTHLEMHMRIEEPPLSGRVSPPPHALGSQCLVPPPFFGLFLGFFWLAFPFVCSCCYSCFCLAADVVISVLSFFFVNVVAAAMVMLLMFDTAILVFLLSTLLTATVACLVGAGF